MLVELDTGSATSVAVRTIGSSDFPGTQYPPERVAIEMERKSAFAIHGSLIPTKRSFRIGRQSLSLVKQGIGSIVSIIYHRLLFYVQRRVSPATVHGPRHLWHPRSSISIYMSIISERFPRVRVDIARSISAPRPSRTAIQTRPRT